jgi:hypothetical protein
MRVKRTMKRTMKTKMKMKMRMSSENVDEFGECGMCLGANLLEPSASVCAQL